MGVGEIGYVDVIADAGTVVGRVIVAVDPDGGTASQCDIEDKRDQVRLGFMGFSADDSTWALCRTGHIEVAKGRVAKAVDAMKPRQHVLHEQLGLAVSVGGLESRILLDGDGFRLSVYGCGGREDQLAGTRGEHGFKQTEGGGGVIAKVNFRLHHRLAGFNEGGEVHDAVEGRAFGGGRAEEIFKQGAVGNIAFDEAGACGKQIAPAMAEVVDDDSLVALLNQERRYVTSDIPRTAGDQDLHKKPFPNPNENRLVCVY